MTKLLFSAIALALTDCLDPLSISVQVYLLTTQKAIYNSIAFIAGILLSTLIAGSIITLGPIKEFDNFIKHPHLIYFIFQAIIGALLLLGSYHYWYHFSHKKTEHPMKLKVNPLSCLILGSSFTITDLPTNIPLLALAEEFAQANYNVFLVILGCFAYSLTRILPLILITGLFVINRDRAKKMITVFEKKLLKWGHYIVALTISGCGLALIMDSLFFFVTGKALFVL